MAIRVKIAHHQAPRFRTGGKRATRVHGAGKPPDPFPNRIVTLLSTALAIARSGIPSPLKSAATTEWGDCPVPNGLPTATVNDPEVFAWLTVKLRATGVAALKFVLPAWFAVTEHVPAPTSVTSEPAFVQTVDGADANETGRPELACATTVNGETPSIWLEIESNAIVWVAAEAVPTNAVPTETRAKKIRAALRAFPSHMHT